MVKIVHEKENVYYINDKRCDVAAANFGSRLNPDELKALRDIMKARRIASKPEIQTYKTLLKQASRQTPKSKLAFQKKLHATLKTPMHVNTFIKILNAYVKCMKRIEGSKI